MKNILIDLFRGTVIDKINLKGLDRAFVVAAVGGSVLLRHCAVKLKKSGLTVRRWRELACAC